MKVAVACLTSDLESLVAPSFSNAPFIAILEIENKQIKNIEFVPNVFQSGKMLATFLKSKDVEIAIAQHFGHGMKDNLESFGIKVIPFFGKVKEVVNIL